MYRIDFDQHKFFQGDILKVVPFIILPQTEIEVNIPIDTTIHELSADFFSQPIQYKPVTYFNNYGMILSQNCDIDNRSFVLVSPIFSVAAKYGNNAGRIENLRKQKINYHIHLRPVGDMQESFVDLQVINAISINKLSIENRIAVLDDYGLQIIQQHLRDYFGRVEIHPYVEPFTTGTESTVTPISQPTTSSGS